jgi:hypothetical protein
MADILTEVNPTLIENTTMLLRVVDGNPLVYRITPVDGYVLHDKARDWTNIDPVTMEETYKQGFTRGTASCGANYDFAANPREFFAVSETSVPADQIFGGVKPETEVM